MFKLFAIVPENPFQVGSITSIIGMAIVLAALALLIGLLYMTTAIVKFIEKVSDKADKKVAEQSVETESTEYVADNCDVVAISAAVAYIYAQEGKSQTKFVVRQIRKV